MGAGMTDSERGRSFANLVDRAAIDNVATFRTCDPGRASSRRWQAFGPMLAIAFAALISSCDEKTDTTKRAGANGPLDRFSEDLLGRTGITAVEAEVRKEARFNKQLKCYATLSDDPNTGESTVKIFVPASGTTYDERKRDAESPQALERLIYCYKKFRIELPPRLLEGHATSPGMGESVLSVRPAHASPGHCQAELDGSCGTSSAHIDCCGP